MGEEVSEYRGVGVGEFGDSGFVNSKMPVPGSGFRVLSSGFGYPRRIQGHIAQWRVNRGDEDGFRSHSVPLNYAHFSFRTY